MSDPLQAVQDRVTLIIDGKRCYVLQVDIMHTIRDDKMTSRVTLEAIMPQETTDAK